MITNLDHSNITLTHKKQINFTSFLRKISNANINALWDENSLQDSKH